MPHKTAPGSGEAQSHGVRFADAGLAQEQAGSVWMRRDLPLDCRVGVIPGMSLDKDEFGLAPHLRGSLKNGFDVARFVARRHNHGNNGLRGPFRFRARDHKVGKGQLVEGP
jgi:hypothetical protein